MTENIIQDLCDIQMKVKCLTEQIHNLGLSGQSNNQQGCQPDPGYQSQTSNQCCSSSNMAVQNNCRGGTNNRKCSNNTSPCSSYQQKQPKQIYMCCCPATQAQPKHNHCPPQQSMQSNSCCPSVTSTQQSNCCPPMPTQIQICPVQASMKQNFCCPPVQSSLKQQNNCCPQMNSPQQNNCASSSMNQMHQSSNCCAPTQQTLPHQHNSCCPAKQSQQMSNQTNSCYPCNSGYQNRQQSGNMGGCGQQGQQQQMPMQNSPCCQKMVSMMGGQQSNGMNVGVGAGNSGMGQNNCCLDTADQQPAIKITEVHECGNYVKLLNEGSKAEYISGWFLSQTQCGNCLAIYKVPPCTYLAPQCSIKVWSCQSDPGCYKLPSDIVFKELLKWKVGEDVTTTLYTADGKVVSTITGTKSNNESCY